SDDPASGSTRKRRYGWRIRLEKPALPEKRVTGDSSSEPSCNSNIPPGLDPFQCWPVPSTPEVRSLVDHYVNVIPSLVCSSGQSKSHQRHLAIDLLHIYRLDPASFQGMLYHSARHRESLFGDDRCSSLTWKIKALQGVNQQIEMAKNLHTLPQDGTIMAIYLLSAAEHMWGDRNTFRLHWRAMYDIIDARGGAKAFMKDDLIFCKILWNCFALLNAQDGYYYYSTDTKIMAEANYDFKIPTESMIQHCNYFINVFSERKSAILRSVPISEAELLTQCEVYPRRVSAFQPGSMMHCVLCPRSDGTGGGGFDTPLSGLTHQGGFSNQIQGDRLRTDNCRLACLIYLNLLFMELGDFSTRTEQFLEALERRLATALMPALTPEYLLWILLRWQTLLPTGQSRSLWMKAIKLIAVVKRASYQSLVPYHRAMFLFLELPREALRLAAALKIDLDTIQDEAL
ncbi:hypothetical protein BO82DRAFT_268656, partial [Aspergillus uvarum CBS 121591]